MQAAGRRTNHEIRRQSPLCACVVVESQLNVHFIQGKTLLDFTVTQIVKLLLKAGFGEVTPAHPDRQMDRWMEKWTINEVRE